MVYVPRRGGAKWDTTVVRNEQHLTSTCQRERVQPTSLSRPGALVQVRNIYSRRVLPHHEQKGDGHAVQLL